MTRSHRKFLNPALRADALFVLCLVLSNLYPIYQITVFGEKPFYVNAFDETSYLQYDYAEHSLGIGRLSESVVILLHELGIPGGIQNFVFDICIPIAVYFFASTGLRGLGVSPVRSKWISILVMYGPAIFLTTNPLLMSLKNYIYSDDILLQYITTPEAWYLPISRSPEPQFSLLLLSFSFHLSTKFRRPELTLLSLPFLDSFVAIAVLTFFCVFLFNRYLRGLVPQYSDRKLFAVSTLFSLVLLSSALWFYFDFFISETLRESLTQSRLPILSTIFFLTGLFSVFVYLLLERPKLSFSQKSAIFSFAVTPLITLNTQLLSGYFAQPNNFEQNAHVFIPALIVSVLLAKKLKENVRLRIISGILMISVLISLAAINQTVMKLNHRNFLAWKYLRDHTDISAVIKSRPNTVIFEDTQLSGLVSALASAKTPSFPLDYRLTFLVSFSSDALQRYINIKDCIIRNGNLTKRFKRSFEVLDKAYTYLNTDYILSHIGRKDTTAPLHRLNEMRPQGLRDCPFYSSR